MKLQRILTLLAVVCLLAFGLTLATAAADVEYEFAVSVSETLDVGDTFDVTVSLKNSPPVKSLAIIPVYDSTKLEMQSGKWIGTAADEAILKSNWNKNKPDLAPSAAYEFATDLNGEVFQMTFKVIAKGADTAVGVQSVVKGYDEDTGDEPPILGSDDEKYDSIEDGNSSATVVTCDHAYGNTWTTDSENHWKLCTSCQEQKSELAAHVYDNACDELCNTCGHTRPVTHDFDENTWEKDANKHWHECASCHAKKDEAGHTYTDACDADCNECDYTRTAPHAYGTEWEKNDTGHWHECSLCHAKKDEAGHTYTGACGATCGTCSHTREVTHTYDETTWKKDENGHWHECTSCHIKKDEAGHTYTDVCDVDCNVCGHTRTAPHAYGTEWEKNDTNHWYECSLCHAKKDNAEHKYSNTCDETCNDCGHTRAAVPHNYNTTWSKDEEGHWHECPDCQARKDEAPHVYTDVCDADCNECGHVRVAPHDYDVNAWEKNDVNHWHECTKCDAKAGEEKHSYTDACDADCNACSYVRAAPHAYGTTWEKDDTNHWHECSLCHDKKDVTGHTYTNECDKTCNACGAERVAPHKFKTEYAKNGSKHWIECEKCSEKKDEATHAYTDVCDDTCNTCGYKRTAPHDVSGASWTPGASGHSMSCVKCGTPISRDHEFSYSCDESCNVCGQIRSAHHDYTTRYDDKMHWEACVSCGTTQNAAAHSMVNGKCACGYEDHVHEMKAIAAKEATCTEAGTLAHYACSKCALLFEDAAGTKVITAEALVVAAKGHTAVKVEAVAPTCTVEGKTEGSRCSACGEVLVAGDSIAATGHVEETLPATEATCTEAGKTEGMICSVCQSVITAQDVIPAKGHTFGEWKTVTEPTSTKEGSRTHTCTVCGETEEEILPKTDPVDVEDPKKSPVTTVIVMVSVVVVAGGCAAGAFIFRKRR